MPSICITATEPEKVTPTILSNILTPSLMIIASMLMVLMLIKIMRKMQKFSTHAK